MSKSQAKLPTCVGEASGSNAGLGDPTTGITGVQTALLDFTASGVNLRKMLIMKCLQIYDCKWHGACSKESQMRK